MTRGKILPLAILCLGGGTCSLLHADTIDIKGTTVSGWGPDDLNTVTTMELTGIATSHLIAQALDNMTFSTNYNFVFAGTGAAADIKNIDPGDLTINTYAPWVVDSYSPSGANAGKNYVTGPDGTNYSRQIQNEDAGGVNFVLSYNPHFKDEPHNINFIQAYSESENGGPYSAPAIDTPSNTGTPFYNDGAIAGSGTTRLSGDGVSKIPLFSSATQAAWMIDDPAVCENGGPSLVDPFCEHGTDEAITSFSIFFDTFIESTQTLSGQACLSGTSVCYDILYGGVTWGYTYTAVDGPELSTWSMFAAGALALLGGMPLFAPQKAAGRIKALIYRASLSEP